MTTLPPIAQPGLAPRFWERKPLSRMSHAEWEALCDGCGKCCLNKLEDGDTGEVALTCVACKLLDNDTGRCMKYATRHKYVPECIVLSPDNIDDNAYWMPRTCAYRLLWQGKPLPAWHPLVSGRAETVHDAGISIRGKTVSELDIPEDDWEDYIIEEPS